MNHIQGFKFRNTMINIVLLIIPVACGRPRFGKRGQVYTPAKTRMFKNEVMYSLIEAKQNLRFFSNNSTALYEKPLALDVLFKMPIPKGKQRGKHKIEEGTPHITKPDTDNLVKAVKDCMSGILYKDDRQVCHEVVRKVYSYQPCIEIKIEEYKKSSHGS